ncbi:putative bifunctional diguanylate cyclase/phosphodiesterase [Quisquiliibacterium transsilvanicum]|uniref:Diguanylate cyclase (GGDEF)-like protein/PAS domain S-box-containing protein n=1 Tax=Quisquiliibacterium transsilvanicum TaxID=1549638 RepID=A0A7W8HH88_9BURK|nr:bifunctional diguanylate cyclase/phosphodiesterase [Quisquiliibacterium transsilvanicum]MBB5271955.1 diguanylate cyclase (GGDEF)-like protein/PAS domain S-box-containing protein [Quisquiliibacterium transsilvanicum]
MMAVAAMHLERYRSAPSDHSIALFEASLQRALNASRGLRDGYGAIGGFEATPWLAPSANGDLAAYNDEMELAAATLRRWLSAPDALSHVWVRRAVQEVDRSASTVELLLFEELGRRIRNQRLLAAAMVLVAGGLSIAIHSLLVAVRARREAGVAALQESEARLAAFAKSLPGLGFMCSRDGRYLAIYGQAEANLLIPRSEIVGRRIDEILPGPAAARILDAIDEAVELNEPVVTSYRLAVGGGERTFEARIVALGDAERLVCLIFDVTAEVAAQQRSSLLAAAMENSSEGILVTDPEGRILIANRAFTDMTGYEERELVGRTAEELGFAHEGEAFYPMLSSRLDAEGGWRGEMRHTSKPGVTLPVFMSINRVPDAAGRTAHFVVAVSDLSRVKEAEESIDHMLRIDRLTGLPNATSVSRAIDAALEKDRGRTHAVAVLLLDIDRFQRINDALGRKQGDELLRQVAARLQFALPQHAGHGRIGHLSGDEFVVVEMEPVDEMQLARLATDIGDAFRAPFQLGDDQVSLQVKIGIAIGSLDGNSAVELLRGADIGIREVKRSGLPGFAFSSQELYSLAARRVSLERRLARALETEGFTLHYQPLVELSSGQVIGAEALVRLAPDGREPIGPAEFIPVMEENGMILDLGRLVQAKACRQLRAWLDAGLDPGFVAVNLSPAELRQEGIVEQLLTCLEESGILPDRLELEVTESGLMEQGAAAKDLLDRLRDHGMRIAIDDFGTGYSSLARLKSLPITKLKIDRSFVRDLPEDQADRQLTTTIVGLAHSLGLRVVAEGVENEAQRAFLEQLGCDAIQGYLVSPPLAAAEYEAKFLSAARAVPTSSRLDAAQAGAPH